LTRYVIAVNWSALHSDAYGVEVLAHEFGHVVTTELYERADPRTRQAIDRAYKTWLSLQEGRSVEDVMREQFPAVTRAAFNTGPVPREYALSFWEWSARNAALYILDPKRPHLTAVERFFAKVGEVLRKIYERVIGPRTDRAWEEAMDAWIAGTMQVRPMPDLRDATFNHEADGNTEVTGGALARTMARRATAPLAPLRDVFGGEKPTREAVLDGARAAATHLLQTKTANRGKVLGLALSTMRQIERMYRNTPLGPALSGWVRNQLAKAKTANRELEAGSHWMALANQLDARVRTTLEQVMYYATHYKVHPDLAFDDAKNQHLSRG
ncbi:hypothetical protein LPQ06_28270, partial [Klebsiella pneumoniae]|nr:hypothetical protein [Klebsiella pneumoniae]